MSSSIEIWFFKYMDTVSIDSIEHPELIDEASNSDSEVIEDLQPVRTTMATPPVRKLWAKKGIDLSQATYQKAWQSEVKVDSSSSPFNLEPELLPTWIQSLKDRHLILYVL